MSLDIGSLQRPLAGNSRQLYSTHSSPSIPSAHRPIDRSRLQRRSQKLVAASLSPGLSTSVSLGPNTEDSQPSSSQSSAEALEAVELRSEAGQDYTALRDALKAGEFQKADDETRALLIKLAGQDAETRGWVYFTEVKFIPEADLQTIDSLWRAASGNKFGYTVQKELWLQSRKNWPKFLQTIDWVQGENNFYRKWPKEFTYSLEGAKGHLPLTNALRGTQLFKALMEHPAFANSAKDSPDWLK